MGFSTVIMPSNYIAMPDAADKVQDEGYMNQACWEYKF